jgi:hypothetical protein
MRPPRHPLAGVPPPAENVTPAHMFNPTGVGVTVAVVLQARGVVVSKVLRAEDELVEWAVAYARKRGVRTAVVVSAALRSFRLGCEGGVPELSGGDGSVRPARSVPPVGPAAQSSRVPRPSSESRAEAFRRATARRG